MYPVLLVPTRTETTPTRPPTPACCWSVSHEATAVEPSIAPGPAVVAAPPVSADDFHCEAATNSFHDGTGDGPTTVICWSTALGPVNVGLLVVEAVPLVPVPYRARRFCAVETSSCTWV